MTDICIASNNKNKIRQFGEMFESIGEKACLYSAKELGFSDFPPETEDTFYGNSKIKATAVWKYLKEAYPEREITVIADDSGLCVDALDGAPGVKSARYASLDIAVDASDEENNKKLIGELKELVEKDINADLSAHYTCCIVAIKPDGTELSSEGRVNGRMVFEPSGNDGFGYDPYFFVDVYNKTFAELTIEERNGISHRGKAVREICKKIIENL